MSLMALAGIGTRERFMSTTFSRASSEDPVPHACRTASESLLQLGPRGERGSTTWGLRYRFARDGGTRIVDFVAQTGCDYVS